MAWIIDGDQLLRVSTRHLKALSGAQLVTERLSRIFFITKFKPANFFPDLSFLQQKSLHMHIDFVTKQNMIIKQSFLRIGYIIEKF